LTEAEPNLRHGMPGALLMPADSVCYPPCVARYLVDKICAAGGNVLFRARVVQVSESGVQLQDGTRISAAFTVLATGAEIRNLLPEISVKPRKGHLLITDRYPGFVRHQIIELGYLKSAHSTISDSVAFNAQPRATGQVLIGSSRQYGAEDPTVEGDI